jgi:5-methyltetrahydrofolate--homocysteine methyltransferase
MEPVLKAIFEKVLEGNIDAVTDQVQEALGAGLTAEVILNEGLIAAMDEVGKRFEEGEIFVPEMLVSARAMQGGLGVLKPHLVEGGVSAAGKVVIGTVKGDLHDIGKNLVAMMLEGSGFEVIDLGTDVSPGAFAEAAREHSPHIIGMSALLTTTMTSMKDTIEALEDVNVREQVKVIVGGAPVTETFANEIGADGFASDASRAVALCKTLV